MSSLPVPAEPVRVALIGAGNRSQTVYGPIWDALAPWCTLVAVCDPVVENGRRYAASRGIACYSDIRALVADRPMEAAIVVTPAASHHSISVYLSANGIHNHTETTWASMVCQTKEMIAVARAHNVVVRVGENFLRMPIDRFAAVVRDSGYLGRIGRIVTYASHTGYHNSSRWIAFAGCHPQYVQSVSHRMEHPAFYFMPQRRFDRETLGARFFSFPNHLFVMDVGSGHTKGLLGRHPRDGYTEWQGERGTLVYRAPGFRNGGETAELRYVSDAKLATAQEAAGDLWNGGFADVITPVRRIENARGFWIGDAADTPQGPIACESPLADALWATTTPDGLHKDWYNVAIMDHVVDFTLAVRGLRESEFSDEDALMSEMMEIGARESALQEGRRIRLPIEGDLESDAITREDQRRQFGVDPLDVEAMLSVSFPRQ